MQQKAADILRFNRRDSKIFVMDHRIARSLEVLLARARPKVSALPRLSHLVEGEGGGESRPALESLLLALSAPRDEGRKNAIHHETLVLWHLLGRRAAELSASAAEGARFVDELLDAFDEGETDLQVEYDAEVEADEANHRERPKAAGRANDGDSAGAESAVLLPVGALGKHARRSLFAAYLEGFSLRREEIARGELEQSALGAIRLLTLGDGIELLALGGRYPHPELGERLEALGRELFRRDTKALLLELTRLESPRIHRDGLKEFIAVAEAIGVHVRLIDERGECGTLLGRVPEKSLVEALRRSRELRGPMTLLRSRIRGFWRANEPS